MVVDCAAVETGCMLEKYIPAKGCNKIRAHFYFLVEVLLLLFTHRGECDEQHNIGFCFLFDTGTQSIAFNVTGYVLLLFLTVPGSCLQHQH